MTADPKALEVIVPGENLTLRDYFKKILLTLWQEQEMFSGEHPFGNSGWTIDVATALVRGGFIEGIFDEHGSLEKWDESLFSSYVSELIQNHLFVG
jgi:hypothetical protein